MELSLNLKREACFYEAPFVQCVAMKFYADLHIHSKYSRATSRALDLPHLALWGAKKGIHLLGTGDFTHPVWLAEIKEQLVPAEPGFFRLRDDLQAEVDAQLPDSCQLVTRFVLQCEISSIYKRGGKTRKIHNLFYMPSLEAATLFHERLDAIGNVRSDGRPILGMDSEKLLALALECCADAKIIPAHIWTPWFALFGSKSGFDFIEDCYGELSDHIFALETGLSSDPWMNAGLSMLDRYTLVSNSDNHSLEKLGREANMLDCAFSYAGIFEAIRTREGFLGTIEFFPEEGKYHADGHRACDQRMMPDETFANKGMCPMCGKPVTVGVLNRIEELADRKLGEMQPGAPMFMHRIPLAEILSELLGRGVKTKTVVRAYEKLLVSNGPELGILNELPIDEIDECEVPRLREALTKMRAGDVVALSGYDGEFGTVKVFDEQ